MTNKNTFCNSTVEEEFLIVTLVLTSITSYQMFWIWKGTIHWALTIAYFRLLNGEA